MSEHSFETRARSIGATGELTWGDAQNNWEDEVSETDGVTIEGGRVRAGHDILDSENLHNQYAADSLSASDQDTIQSWVDDSGNGHDLSGGDPQFLSNEINGYPTVRFDGADDVLDVGFTALSQPYTIAHVTRIVGDSSSNQYIQGSEQGSGTFSFSRWGPDTSDVESFDYYTGTGFNSETSFISDFSIQIIVVDGSNTVYRINGTEETGDPGTNALDGYSLGARQDAIYGNVDITESLVWESGLDSATRDEAVQYLNNKYGVF